MSRWMKDVSPTDPHAVGSTVIASWWPGRFYRVLTTDMNAAGTTEGMMSLSRQLHEEFPEKLGPAPDCFVTVVHRTDRNGVPKKAESYCGVEFQSKQEAVLGHSLIVHALAHSEKRLLHLVSAWQH
jgi:hypothetical protein